jgi:hypothetical protein
MNFKKELKQVTITDEDRKNLSAEDLRILEAGLKELQERELPEATFANPEKFDATGMQKVGGKPVDWNPKKPPQK